MNCKKTLGLMLVVVGAGMVGGCVSNHAIKKDDAAAYNVQLGIAYLEQGKLQVAKEKLDKALSQDPRLPMVHSARAMMFDRLNKPKEADDEFREALRLGGNDPDVENNYAVYLCRIGRTDDGVKLFLQVAHNGLYRTPEAAYTNAGVCLRAAKRYDLAAENLQRALQVRPNYAEANFQLVELYYIRGDLSSARAQLDRFLGTYDGTPDMLLIGVRVARAQGDRVAEQKWGRQLRLDFPGSAQATALIELDRNPG